MTECKIIKGDCADVMSILPRHSFDLVFADPPFNIGYQYDEYDDYRSRKDYISWCREWVRRATKLISPTGSFFLAIGDEYAADYKLLLDGEGLVMRNWIVWHYTFGVNCRNKFSRSHTHILYYVRDPKLCKFNADAIRVPSARQANGDKRAAAGGKVPDDTWKFSRVCGTFRERRKTDDGTASHPCQMPEAILERIILATTDAGDTVLDPFAGSGTTLAVAKRLGRDSVGIELSEAYCAAIRGRLEEIQLKESPHA
jgi:DNA modification methylase